MSRIQLKLMAVLAGLVLFVVLVSGIIAERDLHDREMARITRSLEERAALVAELVGSVPLVFAASEQLDAIADRAAAAAGVRVTLIGADGKVVGDSDVPFERLAEVDNHGDRPEVRDALAGRSGMSSRRSRTVGRRLFYLARPISEGTGVVRLAVDLSDLESAVASLRRALLGAGIVGLLATLLVSYLVSWLSLRPLRELRRVAASIAGGQLDTRLPLRAKDEFGEISAAVNQMADQLSQRLVEATREKEQLRAVLNGMTEAVLVVDSKGEIALANERLREFYGVTGEFVGRTPLAVLRDTALDDVLRQAATTDEPVSGILDPGPLMGRTLGVHAVRFSAGPGPSAGTVAVLHDVTESARLERMRRDFVANASHELRTPLTAVQGFTETLLADTGLEESDRRAYLEIIDRHARRLSHLVDDLLELSRIESEKTSLDLTAVDLSELIAAWMRDARPKLAERKLEATQEVEGSPVAWADLRSVGQIFTNLLENAVNYTNPGGRISVKITGADGFVQVDVSDTGIGIPDADLDRIFERFFRVDRARSRSLGGTGLGLSIVKHLVQSLDGSVSVSSEIGRGSTFSVRLPSAP